jgi:hypothetical protein
MVESTHDAVGGAGGDGELLVRVVVLVQQICAESETTRVRIRRSSGDGERGQERNRGQRRGRRRRAGPLVFLPMSA